jgi:hypothetical protein
MVGLAQPGRIADELHAVDDQVRTRLADFASQDDDRWTFSGRASRVEESRAFFQYPAMMVGTMQRELMGSIVDLQAGVTRIADPFAGSGTVQAEAMYLGLNVVSQDINPLAVLLCRVKADCVDADSASAAGRRVAEAAAYDLSLTTDVGFPSLTKWFRPEAAVDLAHLRRAIKCEADPAVRRFLWVTLAETVRLTSNSRTSTYKLHIRPAASIAKLPAVTPTFLHLLDRNVASQRAFHESLGFRKRLRDGAYSGKVNDVHGDTTCDRGDLGNPRTFVPCKVARPSA